MRMKLLGMRRRKLVTMWRKEQNGSHENHPTLTGKYSSLSFCAIRLTFGKQFDIIMSYFCSFNRGTYSCFGSF